MTTKRENFKVSKISAVMEEDILITLGSCCCSNHKIVDPLFKSLDDKTCFNGDFETTVLILNLLFMLILGYFVHFLDSGRS